MCKTPENAGRARIAADKAKANASRLANSDFFCCGAGGPIVNGQTKTTKTASATETAIANWRCLVTAFIIGREVLDGNKIPELLLDPKRRRLIYIVLTVSCRSR